ncbi:hypothetical protein BGZ94_006940 [Podila epigama]|nr:hypothetical protein BGZ94_006940 [Podila epigama]
MLRPLLLGAFISLLFIYWRQPVPSTTSSPAPKPSIARVAQHHGNRHVGGSNNKLSTAPSRSGRTVAVGDLHSDLPQTLAVLRLANVIDQDENWSGGQDTLVQTGDIVDRGPDTIAIYNLFDKLRKQAKDAGGLVMNLGGDLRYVTEADYASFGGRQKRREAWDVKTGWLGQQIHNNFNITYKNAHTVFSHGDLEPEWAELGVDFLNSMAQEAIYKGNFRAPIFQGNGPIWSRGHATQEGGQEKTCQRIEAVKKALGVHRLISGHTPQYHSGKILSICDGSYMVIDVGISKYYGGHLAALEIIEHDDGTESVYALYPGGKLLV